MAPGMPGAVALTRHDHIIGKQREEKLTALALSFLKRRVGGKVGRCVANTQHRPEHTGFQKATRTEGNKLSNKNRNGMLSFKAPL